MSQVNPNWARWIRASAATYFQEVLGDEIRVHHEGTIPQNHAAEDYVEFRMNGPDAREISNRLFQLRIGINLLCVSRLNESAVYRLDATVGKVQEAFKSFGIYKYGDLAGDDESYVGCFTLDSRFHSDRLRTQQMGRIETDVAQLQATVEGHFTTELRS